jgi:hypothetical protein
MVSKKAINLMLLSSFAAVNIYGVHKGIEMTSSVSDFTSREVAYVVQNQKNDEKNRYIVENYMYGYNNSKEVDVILKEKVTLSDLELSVLKEKQDKSAANMAFGPYLTLVCGTFAFLSLAGIGISALGDE